MLFYSSINCLNSEFKKNKLLKIVMNQLYPYFKIVRPLNCFLSGLSLIIGILITLGPDILVKNILIFSMGVIIITLIAAGGFVINDIYDLEIDKINQPARILPSGKISVSTARIYSGILFFIGLALSFYVLTFKSKGVNLGFIPPFFVIFGIITLFLYASLLKKLGIIGNLLITGLSAIPFIVGGIFINNLSRTVFPVLLVISVMYSREIIKDVEDVKGDIAASDFMLSLPVIIGVKNTINIGKVFLFLTIVFSALPFVGNTFAYFKSWAIVIVAIILDSIMIYSIIILHGSDDNLIANSKKVKVYLKIAILLGLVGLAFNPFTAIA